MNRILPSHSHFFVLFFFISFFLSVFNFFSLFKRSFLTAPYVYRYKDIHIVNREERNKNQQNNDKSDFFLLLLCSLCDALENPYWEYFCGTHTSTYIASQERIHLCDHQERIDIFYLHNVILSATDFFLLLLVCLKMKFLCILFFWSRFCRLMRLLFFLVFYQISMKERREVSEMERAFCYQNFSIC